MKRILVFGLFFAFVIIAIIFVTGRPINGSVFETPIYGGENQTTQSGTEFELFCSNLFTLGQNIQYRRTDGTTTFLRESASRDSNVILRVTEGTQAQVIGAPVCADDYTWWYVSVGGTVGWTAESTNELGYLLEPAK